MAIDYSANKHMLFAGYNFAINKEDPGSALHLDPELTLEKVELIEGDIGVQIRQVFDNLSEVCAASGGDLSNIVKLNIFLTDLSNFATVNQVMGEYFQQPYPARAAIGVSELPKGAQVEMDGILVI